MHVRVSSIALLCLAGLLAPVHALARSAGTPEPDVSAIRVIDIPSQPAELALKRLVELTRFQLLYPPDLVRGKQSVAIRGHMTPREALARMLWGTGVEIVDVAADAATLRRKSTVQLTEGRPEPEPMSILVTARKFSEPVIEVPIAVSVYGRQALMRRGANDAGSVLRDTPGVSVTESGSGVYSISIRGIGTSLGGNENGYYLDDLPFTGVTVPIAPDVRVWDLEQIEVLRGPQGTLFGEGSMGGTVRIMTNKARLDSFEFAGEAGIGQVRGGGTSRVLKSMVNIPLLADRLALRLAATDEHDAGWIDERAGGRENINPASIQTARLRLLFKASDALSVNATHWTYRSRRPAHNQETDQHVAGSGLTLRSALSYTLDGISARYDLRGLEVFYSYARNRFQLPQSGEYFDAPLTGNIAVDVAAHELRIASNPGIPWRWTGGLYRRTALRHDIFRADAGNIDQTSDTATRASSIYGDIAYTFATLPLEASIGFRHFRDKLTSDEITDGIRAATRENAFSSNSPRLALTYKRSAWQQVYASASKGFRSGQNQVSAVQAVAAQEQITLPEVIRPDTIWTYEVGTKISVPQHRAAFELSVYHSNWKDVAVRIPLGSSGFNGLISSDGARASGLDASASYAPTSSFTATLSGGYVHSRYVATVPGTSIRNGSPLGGVPSLTLGASGEYRFALLDRWKLMVRAGIQYASAHAALPIPFAARGDAITNAHARLSFSKGNWTLSATGDNLFNERGAISSRNPVSSDANTELIAPRLRPRTLGLQLRYILAR